MIKKVVIGIIIICVIIVALFFGWYNKNIQVLKNIENFNNEFESYLGKEITGVDLTTIINKALENNLKNNVKKDDKGIYIDNKNNSIQIMIKPTKER